MTIEELEDKNLTVLDHHGNPLTPIEREFLIVMKKLEKEYGAGVVLAIRTLMEAAVRGPINKR